MINQNWHRWIFASVAKYFDDNKGQFPLYIEGQDPLPEELNERAELRINGPFFNETSKNIFQLSIDINLLLNVSLCKATASCGRTRKGRCWAWVRHCRCRLACHWAHIR